MNDTIPHGTVSGHKYRKCPCEACHNAVLTYARERRRQQAYGRWNPLVDADEARAHVRRLTTAGIGWQRIAQLAGVGQSVVQHLLYETGGRGISKRIKAENAAAILAVHPTPALLPPGALVDATGTRRRLQALVADGWPQRTIAARIGKGERGISYLIRGNLVQRQTADAVAAVYKELEHEDPMECGASAYASNRARERARAEGWPGRSAWDSDIDDPGADPRQQDGGAVDIEAVQRALDGKPVVLTQAELLRAARVMTERGDTAEQIAALFGVTSRTVVRWRRANGWVWRGRDAAA